MSAILDTNALSLIRKNLEMHEQQRATVNGISNQIIKLSKTIIYAVHREEFSIAQTSIAEIQTLLESMNSATTAVNSNEKLAQCGAYKVAIQEYVEALTFYSLVTKKTIPSHTALGVDEEYYLLGLMDLTGELVRKAINLSINARYKEALFFKDAVSDIYDELMRFNFGNSELRKKFDGIKYDLKKLEDLALNLKLGGKI